MRQIKTKYSYVTCYEISLEELDRMDIMSCKEPKESLSAFYNRQDIKPDLLINGGFFAPSSGLPIFNLLDEEVEKAFNIGYKWGIGVTNDNEVKYGTIESGEYRDFISGYPNLVDIDILNINYAKEIDGRHPRSLLGYNDEFIYVVTVDGRQTNKPGFTHKESAQLMYDLGCKFAINLDGGGSTRMMEGDKVVNSPSENRSVDNVIAFFLKKEEVTLPEYIITSYPYTVKSGDSLWRIAHNEMGNGLKYYELAKYNYISVDKMLHPGDIIYIPVKTLGGVPTEPTKPAYTLYTIKAGDTLGRIAQKEMGNFNDYKKIMEYNNLYSTRIFIGQVLKIPT